MDVVESRFRVYRKSDESRCLPKSHTWTDVFNVLLASTSLLLASCQTARCSGRYSAFSLFVATLQKSKKRRKRLFGTTDVEISAQ